MLKELFARNKNIIINTDIDGLLSGILLCKHYDCKIVGFCNSKETVWLSESMSDVYSPIYIDMFVANNKTTCIDQHIVAIDKTHSDKLKLSGTKINPNIERGKIFTFDYYHKYPFGTVHYLIALMENEGVKVELPNLNQIVTAPNGTSITVGQIILRADDALFSSLGPYADNAKEWWAWLLSKSNNALSIKSLIDYVNNSNPNTSQDIKEKTGVFFQQGFKCSGKDGAFDEICDDSGNYKKEFIGFATFVNKLLCGKTKIPSKCIPHKGTFKKINVKGHQKDLLNRLMSDENLFSYAFIYGPNAQYSNYSYTLNLK